MIPQLSQFLLAALAASSVQIHPGHDSLCLDVKGDVLANGTPVQLFTCNGSGAQKWTIIHGENPVQLAGTNFCLDAGTSPTDGTKVTIWTCDKSRVGQDWFYTDDLRIAITKHGQCLDVTDGKFVPGTPVQTFKCTTNDPNQIWNTTPSPA